MFGKSKNDPMLSAIKGIMDKNDAQRKAVETVNEHFGVASRRALPLEEKAKYDIAVRKVLAGEAIDDCVPAYKGNIQEASEGKLRDYASKASKDPKRAKSVKLADQKVERNNVRVPSTIKEAEKIDEVSLDTLLHKNRKPKKKKLKLVKEASIDSLISKSREQINEVSKKTLGDYVNKAAADAASNAHKVELSMKAGKDSDAVKYSKKKYKRLDGIFNATKKLVKEDANIDIALVQQEIAENLMKQYDIVAEDSEKLAAFNEALSEEQKTILEQYMGARGVARAPGSPFAPNAPTLAKPFVGPEPLKVNNLPPPVAPSPAQQFRDVRDTANSQMMSRPVPSPTPATPPARKAGVFGMGGFPQSAPKPVPAQRPLGSPTLNANSPEGFKALRQDINTQMVAPRPQAVTAPPSTQAAATEAPTLTSTEGPAPKPTPTVAIAKPAASSPAARANKARAKAKPRRVSAPLKPKRFGFGSDGSGRQDAGSITNRAFGAVNEEVEEGCEPKKSLESLLRERYGH